MGVEASASSGKGKTRQQTQPSSRRLSRRQALTGLGGVAAAGVGIPGVAAGASATRMATPTRLGIAPEDQNAMTMIFKIDQSGSDFTGFGYLTHLEGLHDADLFSDPENRNETTAHFTIFATATLSLRTVLDEGGVLVHMLSSSGSSTFHLQKTPEATFDDPNSFDRGKAVATFTVEYQSVVNAFIPAQGTGTIYGSLTQLTAPRFGFMGKQRRLGVPGMEGRLSASGFSTRTDSVPTATFTLAGNVVITSVP